MAFDTNTVILIGRLTRDPEFSYTSQNNTPLCKFGLANNSGKKEDSVSFFDIVVWNKMAELCNQYLKKGAQVCVNGRLQQNRFQDKSGQNRSKVEVVANSVQFLGSKSDSGGGNSNYQNDSNTTDNSKQSEPDNDPFQNNSTFENVDFNNPDNEEIPF